MVAALTRPMAAMDAISGETIRLLESTLQGTSFGADGASSLSRIFPRWERIVAEVEIGQVIGIDDYMNDLTFRISLAHAEASLSPEEQRNLQELLRPIDDRFRSTTVEVGKPVYGVVEKAQQTAMWFLYRVPRYAYFESVCKEFAQLTGYRCALAPTSPEHK